jgi:chemotaxis protein methyltransferase CheR
VIQTPSELSIADLEWVSELLRKETAIVLGEAKKYLVSSRLKGVASEEGFAGVGALVAAVRAAPNGKLCRAVIESLTTNETYFFRDESLWKYLRATLIPAVMKRRESERAINIWCGASSSGQEPYSLAMLLYDEFPVLRGWRVRIIASDVDETVLTQGREGLYDQFEVNRGLPTKALVAHFERAGVKWRVKEPMRRLIDFRKVNLIGPWGDLGKPDLVFLRNVLIYFDQPARRGVLERVAQVLRPDGHLILGSSEVSHPLAGLFVAIDRASGTHALASSTPKA